MPNLTGTTVVADRYGMPVVLREGDPLPAWAVGKVGAHLLDEESASAVPAVPGPPPKAGAGSSRDAWAAYAADVCHLSVADDDSRDAIIEAVATAQGASGV